MNSVTVHSALCAIGVAFIDAMFTGDGRVIQTLILMNVMEINFKVLRKWR